MEIPLSNSMLSSLDNMILDNFESLTKTLLPNSILLSFYNKIFDKHWNHHYKPTKLLQYNLKQEWKSLLKVLCQKVGQFATSMGVCILFISDNTLLHVLESTLKTVHFLATKISFATSKSSLKTARRMLNFFLGPSFSKVIRCSSDIYWVTFL